jgi:hypothetical protein
MTVINAEITPPIAPTARLYDAAYAAWPGDVILVRPSYVPIMRSMLHRMGKTDVIVQALPESEDPTFLAMMKWELVGDTIDMHPEEI